MRIEVARKTGLSRESRYKALSKEGNPEFATILKVMRALGLKITARAGWDFCTLHNFVIPMPAGVRLGGNQTMITIVNG